MHRAALLGFAPALEFVIKARAAVGFKNETSIVAWTCDVQLLTRKEASHETSAALPETINPKP